MPVPRRLPQRGQRAARGGPPSEAPGAADGLGRVSGSSHHRRPGGQGGLRGRARHRPGQRARVALARADLERTRLTAPSTVSSRRSRGSSMSMSPPRRPASPHPRRGPDRRQLLLHLRPDRRGGRGQGAPRPAGAGQPGRIRERSLEGTVRRIAPMCSIRKSRRVPWRWRSRLPAAHRQPAAGRIQRGREIVIERREDVLRIPTAAVRVATRRACWCLTPNPGSSSPGRSRRALQLGPDPGHLRLEAGEHVILSLDRVGSRRGSGCGRGDGQS